MTDTELAVLRLDVGKMLDLIDKIRDEIRPYLIENSGDLPEGKEFATTFGPCVGWTHNGRGGITLRIRRPRGEFVEKNLDDLWADDLLILGSKVAKGFFESDNAGIPAEGTAL